MNVMARALVALGRKPDYEQINRYETTAQSVQKFEHVEELYRWALYPSLGLLALAALLQLTMFRRLP